MNKGERRLEICCATLSVGECVLIDCVIGVLLSEFTPFVGVVVDIGWCKRVFGRHGIEVL